MMMQLESAIGVNMNDEKQVMTLSLLTLRPETKSRFGFEQTLLTVVQELENTLFEGYVRPKSEVVTKILRSGILDPNMDWYETSQPTGMLLHIVTIFHR
jgi:hypothetical protein